MPTVADDIILSQLSYRDDASTPEPDVDKAADQKVLTNRWQKMEKAGWTYLGNQDTYLDKTPDNGFQAHAYKDPNGKIVIAIRGTEGKGDFKADGDLTCHANTEQRDSALAFTQNVIAFTGKSAGIHVTGHSLGGHLAQEVVKALNSNSIFLGTTKATGSGFNAPGMGDGDSKSDTFININHIADQINHVGGEHLGGEIDLDGGMHFFQVASSHFSAKLANTIINNYSLLAEMDTSVLAALSPGSKDALASALSENAEKMREARQQIGDNSNNTDSPDSIFVFINDTLATYTTKLQKQYDDLEWLKENGDSSDRRDISQLEHYIRSLEGERRDLLDARKTIMQETYGDENGDVDSWIQKYFFDASSTNPDLDYKSVVDLDDTSNQFFVDNDPDIYRVNSAGEIIKSPAFAGDTFSTEGIEIINSDNVPQTREDLVAQLESLGLSSEEAEEIAASTILDFKDLNTENAEPLSGTAPETVDIPQQTPEQIAKEHLHEVKANANIRAADLGIMQAKRDLEEAIDSGDTPEVIIAGLDYLSNFEDRIDLDLKTGENANKGPVGESTEALIDIASSGISLVNSIDNSDEWEIVDNSIDLVQDIDNYLGHSESKYADVINNNTSQILSLGAAGIGLGMALDEGDGWAISQSSATLLQGIDNYFPAGEEGAASVLDNALGFDAGNTGVAFEGVGSAIGLAVNIASLDDVFDSGNSAAAVYTVASTANNAIITYNAAVTLTGNANLAMGSSVPGLGYVAAAVQLTQGDVQGAAITAATTYLITLGPYGWAAAAVLQIGSILFSADDPPKASVSFTLDDNGNVVMDVSGDSEMRDSAEAQGNAMLSLMQDYKDGGGRLLIDGHLPKFTTTQGEGSALTYHSETGGKAAVLLDDNVSSAMQLRGVLIARDRGERVDSAVKVATNSSGEIDFSRVDQIMAGHGFVKKGINYTYGETTERYGTSYGSGVLEGGGNVGPEGEHFTAKASDFTSLPLRSTQSPAQQLGEISRIVSLRNIFSGNGAELMAMALTIPGSLLALASDAEAGQPITETDSDYIKPLDAVELESYLRAVDEYTQPTVEAELEATREPITPIDTPEQMQQFLSEHWSELVSGDYTVLDLTPDSVYHYRDTNHYNGFFSDGSPVPASLQQNEDDESADVTAPQLQAGESEPATVKVQPVDLETESFTGRRLSAEEIPEELAGIEEGAVFLMAEDTTLRFLPFELAEDNVAGTYSILEENPTFAGFGAADNGRIWQEESGDIRFEPTPGFVGTSSFIYTPGKQSYAL